MSANYPEIKLVQVVWRFRKKNVYTKVLTSSTQLQSKLFNILDAKHVIVCMFHH